MGFFKKKTVEHNEAREAANVSREEPPLSQEEQALNRELAMETQHEFAREKNMESIRFGEGRSIDAENFSGLIGKFVESKGFSLKTFDAKSIPTKAQEFIAQLSEFVSTPELKLSNITKQEKVISCMPRLRMAGYAYKHNMIMTGASYFGDLHAFLALSRSEAGWQQNTAITTKKEFSSGKVEKEEKW